MTLYSALEQYRRFAMRAARDLGYGDKVRDKIAAAKSEAEIERIMATARKEKFGE